MKTRAHRVWVMIGLAACASNVGCARMRSSISSTPLMMGAAAPFGKTKTVTPGGDLYAQEVGRGLSHSRALLAQDRARLKARNRADGIPDRPDGPPLQGGTAPLQVALQPPETIQPKEKHSNDRALALMPATGSPAEPPTPAAEPKAKAKSTELADIVAGSRARLESMTSYQVALKRQERVNGALLPAEEVLLSIRRNPKAVRLEWPDGPSKGREVLYSAEDDNLMHVKMPDTIVPVPPLSMAVDSPMVLRSSRHPITEAGFETIVKDLEKNVAEAGTADSAVGKISYEGLANPGQLEQPSHKIVRVTPEGETWLVFLDPTTKLPVMVEGTAANGDLLERYLFGAPTIDPEALATADAFDPGKRWGQSGGLLSRLARSGSAKEPAETETK